MFKFLFRLFGRGHNHGTPTPKPQLVSGKIPEKETPAVRKRARPAPPPKQIRGGRATWHQRYGGRRRKIPWDTNARVNSHS